MCTCYTKACVHAAARKLQPLLFHRAVFSSFVHGT